MKTIPVYKINDFRKFSKENAFYASDLKHHLKFHEFTSIPHKHDFYFLVLITEGKGQHEIDFISYPVKPGSLFVLRPGQMHSWKLSTDCDGYIFFHTRDFYDEGYTSERIQEYSFYASNHLSPLLQLKAKHRLRITALLKELVEEYAKELPKKIRKIHALVSLVYIELSRLHTPSLLNKKDNYVGKIKSFEALVDLHFKTLKSARVYAGKMYLSEKHLNRISTTCLNKTSTDVITERVILEAKRLLIHSTLSVTQIAYELGYSDPSYFNRIFKKRTGQTPLLFSKKYQS